MFITVGKSSSKSSLDGDLIYQLNTNGLSGTENIILRSNYGNEIFAEYDEFLRNYLDIAWIIPIEAGDEIIGRRTNQSKCTNFKLLFP